MNQSNGSIQLSQNGILYLSSGFGGPFTFQVIACHIHNQDSVQLCLSDGNLYIGAIYSGHAPADLKTYSIVKIQAKYTSRWSPMSIDSLQILSNDYEFLLGCAPQTIQDYFLEQKGSSFETTIQSVSTQTNKLQKTRNAGSKKVHKNSEHQNIVYTKQMGINRAQTFQQTQRIRRQIKCEKQMDTKTQKNSGQAQKKNQNLLNTNIKISKINQIQYTSQEKQIKNRQQPVKQNKTAKKIVYEADQMTKFDNKVSYDSFICDLYQRMPRWKILCRINYLRFFVSAKGNKCAALQLIDEKGYEIKAMLYCGNLDREQYRQLKDGLKIGRVYSFSKGEVIRPAGEGKMPLQLILNSNSEIEREQNTWISSITAYTQMKQLLLLQNNCDITIVGIIKNIQVINQQNSKEQRKKIKGFLCNPVQMNCIQFAKNYLQGESVPQQGTLCSLHNFKCSKYGNAIRLIGNSEGKKSYFCPFSQQDIRKSRKKFNQFEQLSKYAIFQNNKQQQKKWNDRQLYNMSRLVFKKRSIKQLLNVVQSTDSAVFSELLCSITQVKIKRQYMACPSCKRSTHQEQVYLWYCIKCCKVVQPIFTLILSIGFADSTGNIKIQIIGDKAQAFIGMQVSQFCGLSAEDKQCHLQMASFQSFVVKIKTEKKNENELSHSLQQVKKQQLQLTMQQIRRRTVEQKLHLRESWDSDSARHIKIQ